LNLRNLTRQHENITGIYVQTKLQFKSVLDQIILEYKGVFGDLHSVVSVLVLKEFPASEDIVAVSEDMLADKIKEFCKSRSKRWAEEKARDFKQAAVRNPFKKTLYQSHSLSLNMYIEMLLQYKEHLSRLESEIDALTKEVEEYKIIQSISGIREKIAATIISEIGEIGRFNHPKKLVAFAEIDPEVFEFGHAHF
jgi:transposase